LNPTEAAAQIELLCRQQAWTELYCTVPEWQAQLPADLHSTDIVTCNAAVTGCELLIARTGTIVLSAANSGRITSVYAPVHICIAYTSQLVYDLSDAFQHLTQKYGSQLPSFITFATGPSRTADIEKTLVVGVHGPKEVYLFLIDDLND
jgi:L-lactate dehydrogenase complex protein LldG